MQTLRLLVIGLLTCGLCTAASGQTLVLSGAHVLNEDGDGWVEGASVVVREGVIVSIGEAPAGDDVTVVTVPGWYVVPGLIDLHTHLLLHPYDEASWNDQVLVESLGLRTARGVAAAEKTLKAGFTTIRDLGTEGAGYADVGIRDAINQGIVPGPRVLATTRAIVATATYAPSGFDPRWDVRHGAQEASGVAEVRKVVREQIAAGADWIKVYADTTRRPGMEATPSFSQEELDALVDESSSAGIPVVAHATTPEGMRRAVRAGVKTIEHGYNASDDVLELMRAEGVVLCPTLAANESMALYSGWTPGEPDDPRIESGKSLISRALSKGVTIACGSDAGVFDHGDNAREIELLVEYGMTPTQALAAATSVAARVLEMEGALGVVAPEAIADIVVVRGDPLQDVGALRDVAMVVKDGVIVGN